MKLYLSACGYKNINEIQLNAFYNNLKRIDKDLLRPLYALFIVDGFINNKDVYKWNKKDILDYVIDRDIELYKRQLKNTVGGIKKKLEDTYFRLKWIATVIGGIKTEDIKNLFETEWNLLEASANDFNDAEDMLNDAGLLKKTENNKYEIEAIFPDLIGEYFVLKQLYNMKDEDIRDKLEIIWNNKPNIAFSFFTNLLLDFSYLIGTTQIELKKWNLVTYPNIDKENLNTLKFYCMFLVNLMGQLNLQLSEQYIGKLQELVNSYRENQEITLAYANGLVNLSIKQNKEEAIKTIGKLQELVNNYRENQEIALLYAKGLLNLSIKQNEEEATKTIRKFQEIVNKYRENPEIDLLYAVALSKLIIRQNEEEATKTIRKFQEIVNKYRENLEIDLLYAIALINLSIKQNEEEATKTISKLQELFNKYRENPEIISLYGKGLVNLT